MVFHVRLFFPPKIVLFLGNVEKYCRARQATGDRMAHALCMLDNLRYKYSLRICNTYSTATQVARAHISVTVPYVACPVLHTVKNVDQI
jgi:hypothetical protein